ncbi:hypothetical protein FA09DRAFT_341507 [Tilletiopsis washingtonensis]|uniref:Uncharacterized protein n=1 Tax=Tilletiopsis washingtonensis TaxID=58919 RepID=A0A316Z004_9BASI|nr:hypothetical protein FA09DRAFT_341507 [Tilletiopsis washingtonensis]PWN95037.1 hypothetical protein FA09DRAFT_341507 [Tilletiopsis washingtonensis]
MNLRSEGMQLAHLSAFIKGEYVSSDEPLLRAANQMMHEFILPVLKLAHERIPKVWLCLDRTVCVSVHDCIRSVANRPYSYETSEKTTANELKCSGNRAQSLSAPLGIYTVAAVTGAFRAIQRPDNTVSLDIPPNAPWAAVPAKEADGKRHYPRIFSYRLMRPLPAGAFALLAFVQASTPHCIGPRDLPVIRQNMPDRPLFGTGAEVIGNPTPPNT